MGWINVLPDGSIKYYSLADTMQHLFEMFFSLWSGMTPGYLMLMFTIAIAVIVVGLVWSVYHAIKSGEYI